MRRCDGRKEVGFGMKKRIWFAMLAMLGMSLVLSGVWNAGAESAASGFDEDLFLSQSAQEMETFAQSGTGILLLGTADDAWTQATAALAEELCVRSWIGVIRYVNPADCEAYAAQVQAYLEKGGTSFANVAGSTSLIEENISCDARDMQGVLLFVNKGTVIGAQVGTAADAQDPQQDVSESLDEILDQMESWVQKLGSSPCPTYC